MSSWADYLKTMRPENDVHVFARSGEILKLKEALRPGNVDIQDARGHSPLMLACYNGHSDTAELLIAKGADPNLRDNSGHTVLMGAAFKGHLEVVKLLVRNGADVRLENPQGLTARGFAELFGRHEVTKYLASIEAQ